MGCALCGGVLRVGQLQRPPAFVWAVVTGLLTWAFSPVKTVGYLVLPFLHTTFAIWQALLFGRFLQEEAGSFGLVD